MEARLEMPPLVNNYDRQVYKKRLNRYLIAHLLFEALITFPSFLVVAIWLETNHSGIIGFWELLLIILCVSLGITMLKMASIYTYIIDRKTCVLINIVFIIIEFTVCEILTNRKSLTHNEYIIINFYIYIPVMITTLLLYIPIGIMTKWRCC